VEANAALTLNPNSPEAYGVLIFVTCWSLIVVLRGYC
jgi:hypothetical protein